MHQLIHRRRGRLRRINKMTLLDRDRERRRHQSISEHDSSGKHVHFNHRNQIPPRPRHRRLRALPHYLMPTPATLRRRVLVVHRRLVSIPARVVWEHLRIQPERLLQVVVNIRAVIDMQLETEQHDRQSRVGMREVFGNVLRHVRSPPTENQIPILHAQAVVVRDVHDVPEHDLPGKDVERDRPDLEIPVFYVKPVERFRDDVPGDAAVVIRYVHDPGYGGDEAAEQPDEVAVHFDIFAEIEIIARQVPEQVHRGGLLR